MRILKTGMSLMALSCLTACSSIYSDTFECKAGKGVPCTSISDVNAMVSRGEIGRVQETSLKAATSDPVDLSTLPSFQDLPSGATGVVRLPEQTLRVWLAPHLEDSGTWSGARYVYTVITPGRWVDTQRRGRPLKKKSEPEVVNTSVPRRGFFS